MAGMLSDTKETSVFLVNIDSRLDEFVDGSGGSERREFVNYSRAFMWFKEHGC
jgi:hypothetical protein